MTVLRSQGKPLRQDWNFTTVNSCFSNCITL